MVTKITPDCLFSLILQYLRCFMRKCYLVLNAIEGYMYFRISSKMLGLSVGFIHISKIAPPKRFIGTGCIYFKIVLSLATFSLAHQELVRVFALHIY